MDFRRRLGAAAATLAAFAIGLGCAAAIAQAMYATAALALLVLALLIVRGVAAVRPRPPAAPPSAPGDDAAERRRLAAYLDLSPAPMVALDAGHRPQAVNRAARGLLAGRAPGDTALADAIAATGAGRSATVRIDTEAGPHVFALVTADIVAGGTGERVAALIDIESDLKAAEAATLRDLVQVLGHEITNSLTPIAALGRLAAQMLADPDPDHAAIADAVETVARRAEGLRRFGDAYRTMARLPAPTLRGVDIGALLADQARLFATRWPDVALDTALPGALWLRVDPDQLAQAVWALLQNAAEAGCRVGLGVRIGRGHAVVEVDDDGPGVPADRREAIFRPFFTTKPEGSGVGLALARQIGRGHGGDLTVIDRSGPGACFALALPMR